MRLGKQAYLEEHKDLVALRPAKGEDRLSQFLRDHCSHWMKVLEQYFALALFSLLNQKHRSDANRIGNHGTGYITFQRHESPKPWERLVSLWRVFSL